TWRRRRSARPRPASPAAALAVAARGLVTRSLILRLGDQARHPLRLAVHVDCDENHMRRMSMPLLAGAHLLREHFDRNVHRGIADEIHRRKAGDELTQLDR